MANAMSTRQLQASQPNTGSWEDYRANSPRTYLQAHKRQKGDLE